MKNRIIQSLVEQNNAVFLANERSNHDNREQSSKNVIVSKLEESVSAHKILAGTLNVKEDLKENASNKQKNNTPEIVNDFSTDHIDAVDWNIITGDNNSIPNNIPGSIPDNSKLIDFNW